MAMQLASMVHASARDQDTLHHAPHHQHQLQHHPQHHSHLQHPLYPHHAYYHQQPSHNYTATATTPSSASTPSHLPPPPPPPRADFHYSHHRPQSPPSPPAEEHKMSLPSISNLLAFAGGDKPSTDTGRPQHAAPSPRLSLTTVAASSTLPPRQSPSPQPRQALHSSAPAMSQPVQAQSSRPDQLAQLAHYPPSLSLTTSNSRMALPPTPPMHSDATHDGNHSPSATSTHSAASGPYLAGSALNNVEPHQQRQSVSSLPSLKRDSLPSHSMSPYTTSVYGQSPYASSPSVASATSFYSPEQQSLGSAAMYAQRPLPAHFPPQTMPLSAPGPSLAANNSNPWQHHHYISTSSQSQFQQSQDRYICSTCNKAFSRPSSLRIHSHSHTGEKPYKCPQPGCAKAFSVRSNMKRHERGCHTGTGSHPLTT